MYIYIYVQAICYAHCSSSSLSTPVLPCCGSFMTTYITFHALCLLSTLGSLVPAMCNRTLGAQVHELSQSHCGYNREGTLFS